MQNTKYGEHMNKRTVQIDVTTSIPVEVAQDMLADRALELLKRELTKAAKRTVSDFIANGISASIEDLSIKAEKHAIRYSVEGTQASRSTPKAERQSSSTPKAGSK